MKQTYLIKYTAYDKQGEVLKTDGVIKVKNRDTEFEAKCSFENYLQKKHPNFGYLVIHECSPDDVLSTFDKLFGDFDSNPFRKRS